MSVNSLYDISQTVFSVTRESTSRSCSISVLWKRVYQVSTGAIAAASSIPFFSGLRLGQSRVFQIFEGCSRLLFSLNNFEVLYGNLAEDSPRKDKSIALKTGIMALSLGLQVPLVLYSYDQNSPKNWVFPVAEGLCGSALTFASLCPDNFKFFELKRAVSDQERKKQKFLDCIDICIKDLSRDYKDLNRESLDPTMILTMILSKYEKEPKTRDSYCNQPFRAISAGVGIAAALYLSIYYQEVTSEGVLRWDEAKSVLAALVSGTNLIVHLPVLGRMCVATSVGYYDTITDILTCRYQKSLAAIVAPYLWTASRVSTLALSYLSFHSVSSAMKDCIPIIGETLSVFAPVASAFLLHDTLNRFFDRKILAAKSLCDKNVKFVSHLSDSLRKFRQIFKDAELEDIEQFFQDLGEKSNPYESASGSLNSADRTFKNPEGEEIPYRLMGEFEVDLNQADIVATL
jgi:hypothetical protein